MYGWPSETHKHTHIQPCTRANTHTQVTFLSERKTDGQKDTETDRQTERFILPGQWGCTGWCTLSARWVRHRCPSLHCSPRNQKRWWFLLGSAGNTGKRTHQPVCLTRCLPEDLSICLLPSVYLITRRLTSITTPASF